MKENNKENKETYFCTKCFGSFSKEELSEHNNWTTVFGSHEHLTDCYYLAHEIEDN